MRRALGAAVALALACGVKSPPRPPLHPAPDGGVPRLQYTPAPILEEDGGERATLRWRHEAGPIRGRLVVEEHLWHSGEDGPKCGRRRVIALVPAAPEISLRIERPQASATYRLLEETGEPVSRGIDVAR